MTSYSRLQTNVLAKFVDTACIFRDAGAGGALKQLRAMETYILFLFINNIDLKNNNRNYRKSF